MKVLIIEACFVPHATEPEQGPQLLEQGSVAEVDKDTAAKLANAGKAFYTAKSDDPSRGHKTASAELLDAAARAAKEAARAAKAEKPAGTD